MKSHPQEVATTQKPKEALNTLILEKGGENYAKNVASLPRDSRQISYAREKKHMKDPNPLYSVMLECKLAQGKADIYVQDVKAAPQPMCILSFEWQFLTNNNEFGILTVDTTYNLGNFYVTPLTYPHLMLQDTKSRKSPLMLGPILVQIFLPTIILPVLSLGLDQQIVMYSLLEVMETKHLLKHLPTIFHLLFSYDVSYIFGEIFKKTLKA